MTLSYKVVMSVLSYHIVEIREERGEVLRCDMWSMLVEQRE